MCIVLGYLEFRIIWCIQVPNAITIVNETLSVLSGNPFWRAYQNRLMSGFIIQQISTVFSITDIRAYQVVGLFMCSISNIAAYHAFKKSLHNVMYFIVAFIFLQSGREFYAWDYFDLLFFTLLALGISQRKSIFYFTVLFFAAIFNRESALFIPLWLVIDGSFGTTNWKKILFGICLILCGVFIVTFLREHLFIASHMERIGVDESHQFFGNHFCLTDNILSLSHDKIFYDFDFMKYIVAGFIFWIVLRTWKDATIQHYKIVVFIISLIASNVCFALINETRVWFTLIPICLMYYTFEGETAEQEL